MTIDASNVRVHVCPPEVFEKQIMAEGRAEVREPNGAEADTLRGWLSDRLKFLTPMGWAR